MLERLKRFAPVGMEINREVAFWLIGNISSFLIGLFVFLARYANERQLLFNFPGGRRQLVEGALIPHFRQILGMCHTGFFLVILCMLGFLLYHYLYYRQGSMSIYLMKRLPKKTELYRQVLTLPCLGILATLLLAAVFVLFCLGIYLLFTPKVCLPYSIWRFL